MILKYEKNDVIFGVIKDCYVFKETIKDGIMKKEVSLKEKARYELYLE